MSREAMKLALGNICSAKLCEINSMSSRHEMIRLMDEAIATLKQALEQPEPEPDGLSWLKKDSNYFLQPKREPEPVAVVSGYYGGKCVVLPTDPARIFNSGTAFYTNPPKRKPLSDEQMEQIHQQYGGNIKKIMRAVEAAHEIKGEQHGTR